ncbi:MAG: MFS transporter [Acidimicrobiia bacterium]|nr:MFS transporter [Acidimicrobiia bacterium]
MVGNGLQGSVLGVRAELEGFGFAVTGGVMASYFVGFLFGTAVAVRFVAAVGHIRVFTALASLASSAAVLHAVWVHPAAWALLRLTFGLCMAGLYVVAESWLNDMATNANRGRVLAGYMVVMLGGLGSGQLLLSGGDPASFELFVVVSVLISLALVPVALSATTSAPQVVIEPLPLRQLLATMPTGAVTALLTGAAHGTLLSLAAVYGSSEGLSDGRIALFTAVAPLGAVAFQLPIGALSDRFSRRGVLGVTAVGAAAAAAGSLLAEPGSAPSLALMFLFGGFTFPLHSLAVALTVDRVAPSQITSASATLARITGTGAAIFPAVTGAVMGAAGTAAFFVALAAVHALIAGYVGYRVVTHPTIPAAEQTDYLCVPARGTAVTATFHPDLAATPPLPAADGQDLRTGDLQPSTSADNTDPMPEG